MDPNTKICPNCAEEIPVAATKCKFCKEDLEEDLVASKRAEHDRPAVDTIHKDHVRNEEKRKWTPGKAALLSFIIPGAGQIYKGNIISGFLWFVGVITAYFLFLFPGFILHFICIFSATTGHSKKD
jgi:TM2 domain-containing membrane protein YozV